jgi:elongation factor G
MAGYTTADVRNIALVGQAGTGKTSLVEALLHEAGVKPAVGDVDKGDTVTDFDPLEQQYHHSLNLAVVSFDARGRRINLIDTPGYADFLGQTLSGLAAAETMAVVVSAQTGIEPMTRRMMDWAAAQHMPCMVLVNKIDTEPDRLSALLGEITEAFGKECLPMDLPAGHAERVVEVIGQHDGSTDFSSVEAAHTALVEQVVEVDEDAMEEYLDSGDVAPNALHAPFEQALREGHLIPVCFVSARTGAGMAELLQVFTDLAPSPLEGNPHAFVRRVDGAAAELWAKPDADAALLAHVFKVDYDMFVGKIAYVRVHQGTLNSGDSVLVDREGKPVKVAHLLSVHGKKHTEAGIARAGDICALTKIDELHQDAVLHASHDHDDVGPPRIHYPTPLVGLALHAKRRGDEQKITDVLHRLVAEDPGLRIEYDMTANETVLRGLGDLHLRVALDKLEQRYHVQVETHPPSIPYRETITRPAQGHCRHKKQTGGAGQFGEVYLDIEPLERGAGFEFVDQVKGGVIPAQFIPAVEKGVRQVLGSGVLAGYPMEDVRVTVTDGKHHPVDSKEIAFVAAGRKAFLDAVGKAAPILLEPMVNLEVTVPAEKMGDVSGDLAARRGRVSNTIHGADGKVAVQAQAPLAELEDYAARLKSLTGGEAVWSIQFSHYEPVPPRVQERLARHQSN